MRYLLARGVAYIMHPPWAKYTQRALLASSYVMMGFLGWLIVAGVEGPIGSSGWVVVAGTVVSLLGVTTRFYQIEAIGIWPQVTGLLALIALGQLGSGSVVVGAYCALLGLRLLELNVVAWNARKAMERTGGAP